MIKQSFLVITLVAGVMIRAGDAPAEAVCYSPMYVSFEASGNLCASPAYESLNLSDQSELCASEASETLDVLSPSAQSISAALGLSRCGAANEVNVEAGARAFGRVAKALRS